MLLLTIGILIVLVIISFALFERDIFAPPTVVSLGLLFGSLCTFYREEDWALDFSFETTWVISIGVLSFILGGIIALLLFNIRNPHISTMNDSHVVYPVVLLDIKKSKTIMIIVFQLITAVLLFQSLREITGGGAWYDVVSTYRMLTGAFADVNDVSHGLPFVIRNCTELTSMIGIVYAYIVGNRFAAGKKQVLLNWLPIILSALITFMLGYRAYMLRIWVAILIVTYILKKRSVGWVNNKNVKKIIKNMAASVIVVAVLFVGLRSVVGRTNLDIDPLEHLTNYAGSPVAALDLFLKDPLPPSDIWGKETFFDLNQSLRFLYNSEEEKYNFFKEFRQSPNGTYIGNIYTALRPPYYDFGFVGMIVVMVIMGLFFTFFYYKVRNQFGHNPIDFRLLLYAYVAYTFFMYFYNCYNTFISHRTFKLILELLLIRWFLVGWYSKDNHKIIMRLKI